MITHRHRHAGFILPKRAPSGRVEIDWTHPLARGLIGCYMPANGGGLIDICGIGPRLTRNTNGSQVSSLAGESLASITAPAGASATAPATYLLATAGTCHWFGDYKGITGAGATECTFIGINVNGGSSPFVGYGLMNTHVGLGFYSNSAGTFEQVLSSIIPASGLKSVALNFVFAGGAYNFYVDGVLQTGQGGTTAASAPTYTTPVIAMGAYTTRALNANGAIGHIYNRSLADDELMRLSQEPFSMLRPLSQRVFGIAVTVTNNGGPMFATIN